MFLVYSTVCKPCALTCIRTRRSSMLSSFVIYGSGLTRKRKDTAHTRESMEWKTPKTRSLRGSTRFRSETGARFGEGQSAATDRCLYLASSTPSPPEKPDARDGISRPTRVRAALNGWSSPSKATRAYPKPWDEGPPAPTARNQTQSKTQESGISGL